MKIRVRIRVHVHTSIRLARIFKVCFLLTYSRFWFVSLKKPFKRNETYRYGTGTISVPNENPGFRVDRLFQRLKKTLNNYVIFEITERQKVQKPLFSLDYFTLVYTILRETRRGHRD